MKRDQSGECGVPPGHGHGTCQIFTNPELEEDSTNLSKSQVLSLNLPFNELAHMYFFLLSFSFSRDDHSFCRGGHKYHYFKPRLGIYRKDYHPPKPYRVPVREEDEREDMERQREKEKVKDERGKEQYDLRESIERNSPTRPSSSEFMNTEHIEYTCGTDSFF